MKKFKNLIILILILILIISFLLSDFNTSKKNYDIGTGSQSGVYWPVGNAIADIANKVLENEKLSASATGGSTFNSRSILQGGMDFGIIQSDIQYQVYTGEKEWKKFPEHKNLRTVMDLHFETVTLVVAEDAEINTFFDLVDKKVNLGNIGSGQRKNAEDLLNYFGIKLENSQSASPNDSIQLFQDSRIDAFFFTAGHPNSLMKQIFSGKRKAKVLDITVQEDFFTQYPFYKRSSINSYQEDLGRSVQSIGVRASLCTKESTSKELVYEICQAVVENFSKLKETHSSFERLDKEGLAKYPTIPLHEGARQFFKK